MPFSNFGCFTTASRTGNGKLSVHCRWLTLGKVFTKCTPVSVARRAVHDGHHPRPLHENATSLDSLQLSHFTSTKPHRSCPQSRYRCTSSFTLGGRHPGTEAQPRRKASSNTDFSGARRRPSSNPPTPPLYSLPLTSLTPACVAGFVRGIDKVVDGVIYAKKCRDDASRESRSAVDLPRTMGRR